MILKNICRNPSDISTSCQSFRVFQRFKNGLNQAISPHEPKTNSDEKSRSFRLKINYDTFRKYLHQSGNNSTSGLNFRIILMFLKRSRLSAKTCLGHNRRNPTEKVKIKVKRRNTMIFENILFKSGDNFTFGRDFLVFSTVLKRF